MYIFIHNMSVCVNKLDICTNIGVYIKACIHTYIHTYTLSHFSRCRVRDSATANDTYIHTYKHTLHYITLHYTALHCTALHYTTLHYITLHYIHTYMHMYSTNT